MPTLTTGNPLEIHGENGEIPWKIPWKMGKSLWMAGSQWSESYDEMADLWFVFFFRRAQWLESLG